jgi:cold shock CspA family protein
VVSCTIIIMTRQVGTVAKWLNRKGIGFITPQAPQADDATGDYLVHYSNIKQGSSNGDKGRSFKSLAEGSLVEFETAVDPKNADKMIAINVTAVGGGDCERQSKTFGRRNFSGEAHFVAVGNLAKGTSWKTLKDIFRSSGCLVDWVDVDKEGKGIVRFTKEEDARNAVEKMNGLSINGQELEVSLSLDKSKK